MPGQQTLFEKVWDAHIVAEPTGRSPLIYIDLHLVHEVTSPQAFDGLRAAGSEGAANGPLRSRPSITTSRPSRGERPSRIRSRPSRFRPCRRTAGNSASSCSTSIPPDQGIVHVIGPELGLTQPGMTIVCGDSHTSTHGAFGVPGVRHWDIGSGARAGDAMPAAAQAEDDEDRSERLACRKGCQRKTWRWE